MTSYSKSLPSASEARAEKCRRHFRHFVRHGWEVLEPGTRLAWNWHIDAICDHCQAVTRGEIRNLLINIPPGHMKSLIVSVFWPAWEWIEEPEVRSLFSSYALDLSLRDSVRFRDLVQSDWYQDWFCPEWRLSQDQKTKSNISNGRKGFRLAMSVGGRATGFRGNKIVTDDPLNAKEMHSLAAREECLFWWDKVMSSRLNDMRTGAKVIIMQRLHEQDLSGHVLGKGVYEHLCLPSEFEPDRRSVTFILRAGERVPFWEDPRTEPGELLFPELFPRPVLDQARKDLGEDGYAGQHMQAPAPPEGGMLKRHHWRFWKHAGQPLGPVPMRMADGSQVEIPVVELPAAFDEQIQSWDMAFKDTKASDFVVGQAWGRTSADKWLLEQVRDRLSFTASVEAVREMSARWPRAYAKLVEDKANGPAIIDTLTHEIAGMIAVNPEGGKEARCAAVSPQQEAHNVYLPHPDIAPWVWAFIERCAAFPKVTHDDEIDALSQALLRLSLVGDVEVGPDLWG